MLPAVLNLEMIAGDGYRNTITFKDASGSAINVSGYTFRAQVRKNPKSTTAVSFTIDNSGGATGIVIISLTGAQVRSLGIGKSKWDMEYVVGNSDPTTVLKGDIKVNADVTREEAP